MTTSNRAPQQLRRRTAVAIALLSVVAGTGCQSSSRSDIAVDLDAARSHLARPLSGDPAALYKLRVSSSGGLRLAVLTSGDAGRLTVSEPFGSAVSVTAWNGAEDPVFFDLREGCRLDSADLSQVLGIGAMPLPQAVNLLGGRLPATDDDDVIPSGGSSLLIGGQGWQAEAAIAADPWRVLSVRDVGDGGGGWTVRLSDHTSSVPGTIVVKKADGRWAELELVRLEWNQNLELPELPDLPRCTGRQ